jgi:hypothetical protein
MSRSIKFRHNSLKFLVGPCADGGKSSKRIVCKSPGVNIENPGDALCCIIRQSYLSCHCVKN